MFLSLMCYEHPKLESRMSAFLDHAQVWVAAGPEDTQSVWLLMRRTNIQPERRVYWDSSRRWVIYGRWKTRDPLLRQLSVLWLLRSDQIIGMRAGIY